ncbi:MAG: bacteriohemerythrin [Armatimonadota bacterium]|nr:bacteriohemerythrin [bacterium]
MPVQWTNDLAVGITEIDDQHKELFRRINDLLEAADRGKDRGEIDKFVAFLQNHLVTHFATEEKYMLRYGYPHYTRHKARHTLFIMHFTGMKRGNPIASIAQYTTDWLLDHIDKADKALGAFLTSIQTKKAA